MEHLAQVTTHCWSTKPGLYCMSVNPLTDLMTSLLSLSLFWLSLGYLLHVFFLTPSFTCGPSTSLTKLMMTCNCFLDYGIFIWRPFLWSWQTDWNFWSFFWMKLNFNTFHCTLFKIDRSSSTACCWRNMYASPVTCDSYCTEYVCWAYHTF